MRARNVLSSNLRTRFCFTSFAELRLLRAQRVQKKKAHRLVPPRGFALRTKFAEEFPCEHGTSFRRICELDSASLRLQNCVFYARSAYKKRKHTDWCTFFFWRRHPDSDWGQRCCRPLPYHLAMAPYFLNVWIIAQRILLVKGFFKYN